MNEHTFCEGTKPYVVPDDKKETNIVFYTEEVPAEALENLSGGKGDDNE